MRRRPAEALRRFEHRAPRGFTLLELMVTLVVAGLLLGVTTWAMQGFLVAGRVGAAARDLTTRLRSAAAIAARTNRPVEVEFVAEGDGCVPRYTIRTTGKDAATYETVCIPTEYPGVTAAPGAMAGKAVRCGGEPALPVCSLCEEERTLTFFPSGEARTSDADEPGDSIVFSPRGDESSRHVLAVGIHDVSGRARVYRPNAAGSGWECP